MKKITICMFFVFYCSSFSYSQSEKPLQSLDLNDEIYSALLVENEMRLIVGSKQKIYQLSLKEKKSSVKEIEINSPNVGIFNLVSVKNSYWGGGGFGWKGGHLFSFDLSHGSYQKIGHKHFNLVTGLAYSENNVLATCHGNGEIILWDTLSKKEMRRFGERKKEIFEIKFLKDGNVITGDEHGELIIWDFATGKKIKSATYSQGGIYVIVVNNIDNKIISGDSNGDIIIYRIDDLSFIKRIHLSDKNAILSISLRKDRQQALCGLTYGNIGVIDLTNSQFQVRKLHEKHVRFVSYYDNESKILSLSEDGMIKIFKSNSFVNNR